MRSVVSLQIGDFTQRLRVKLSMVSSQEFYHKIKILLGWIEQNDLICVSSHFLALNFDQWQIVVRKYSVEDVFAVCLALLHKPFESDTRWAVLNIKPPGDPESHLVFAKHLF